VSLRKVNHLRDSLVYVRDITCLLSSLRAVCITAVHPPVNSELLSPAHHGMLRQ